MFALFGRKRSETPVLNPRLRAPSLLFSAAPESCPADPEAQVALVHQAVTKLEEVRRLVGSLPEIPLGDRDALLSQLACTSESLRSLYFLDAIY